MAELNADLEAEKQNELINGCALKN